MGHPRSKGPKSHNACLLHPESDRRTLCAGIVVKVQNCPVIIFPPLRTNRRPAICVLSIVLPKTPVNSSSGDEVPHILTRKSRLRPGEFLIASAKRLLQQYLPADDINVSSQCIAQRYARVAGTPFERHAAVPMIRAWHGTLAPRQSPRLPLICGLSA